MNSPNSLILQDTQIMKRKHALVPGSLDALEDRLVLSHVGAIRPALLGSAHVRTAASTLPPTSIKQLALKR
jgi:hypothetical protein